MRVETFKTVLISVMATVLAVGVLAACTGHISANSKYYPAGGDYALNNQNRLFYNAAKATGWHQPRWSEEIANHLVRNMRYNNHNHKSFVYVYANNGAIKAYFPVVGKCSSTDSSPTSLLHATDVAGNNDTSKNRWLGNSGSQGGSAAGATVDSPQLDGSYGFNEPGIFCFLDKPGRPMVTFNGDYIMSDQYMPLKQAPELIVDEGRSGVKGKK